MLRALCLRGLRAGYRAIDNSFTIGPACTHLISSNDSLSVQISLHTCPGSVFDQQCRHFVGAVPVKAARRQNVAHGQDVSQTTANSSLSDAKEDAEEDDKTSDNYAGAFASRIVFRKTSPEQLDLKYRDSEAEQQNPVKFKSKTGRRNTPYWYFLQCKKLIKQNKLAEALQLFEGDMLRGERLQPEEYNYTVLIGGCGRIGYLKKAFKLYNNMKKRGLEPSDATYTALFNACAESPWKQTGLEQAMKLRQELRMKNIQLNAVTQHALLKTVALASNLRACFQVLREMLQSGHPVSQETFQYLLMACVKDKEQGFRLALQVWHQMLSMGIKPDTPNYNILLRAARECGIGDPAVASALLLRKPESTPKLSAGRKGRKSKATGERSCPKPIDLDAFENQLFVNASASDLYLDSDSQKSGQTGDHMLHIAKMEEQTKPPVETRTEDQLRIDPSQSGENLQLIPLHTKEEPRVPIGSLSCSLTTLNSRLPNLLDPLSCNTDVIALGTVSSPSDRLALIGNLDGFLSKMSDDKLEPDIKTFTLLADVVEPGSQSVQRLISVARQKKLKLDVTFFNTVIRKAAKAGDLVVAKVVRAQMEETGLVADMQTFSSLALACLKQRDGLQLLADMEASGIVPNAYVYSALIGQASRRLDYAYLHTLLRHMEQMKVPPNDVIIRQLEFASQYPPTYDKFKSKNTYLEKIDGFRGYYKQWLERMPGQETPHPWAKYRLPNPEPQQDQ
ncbi:pentatricopeptide repeat-containing protein 1, mitochondrial [Chanos chanos]|uniref:Pentatricopeptide repeat-containing protein 1, mitochondrial n=1 Tax=Chanos chanos TaxID=29144 RepID=A0A6J2VS67_CHACN|nr:pentatricopeptide repeat-containing protein 1, mitochondrial-like [Chanos chanos]